MGIDAKTAMQVFDPRPDVDEVWPGKGVIYSQRLSAQRTKSRLSKIVGTPAYKSITIRSSSTTMAVLAGWSAEYRGLHEPMATYPLIPKTTAHLRPGQFWSIPMADGRFGCGRVLRVDTGRPSGGRTRFIGAILDWVGDSPPSSEAIAGSPVLNVGNAHVRLVSFGGGAILGERPLAADGIEPPATVDTYWGDGYAVARAERRFIAGDPPPTSDFRQVSSPLTDEMLRPSLTGRGVVQFDRRLTDDDFRQLGEWFRAYPEMDLRAYGSYDHSITDLEFLRFFPTLRRFAADALWDSLTSLDGLRHLPTDLEELGIGATKVEARPRRPVSLSASCDGSSSRVRRSTSR